MTEMSPEMVKLDLTFASSRRTVELKMFTQISPMCGVGIHLAYHFLPVLQSRMQN